MPSPHRQLATGRRRMPGLGLIAAIAAALSLGPGCSRKADASTPQAEVRPKIELREAPLLAEIPVVAVDARVKAVRSERITSPGTGELSLLFKQENQLVKKGEPLAVFDAAGLKAERDLLAARKSRLQLQQQRAKEIDLPRKQAELEAQLAEAMQYRDIFDRLAERKETREAIYEITAAAGVPGWASKEACASRITLLQREITLLQAAHQSEAAVAEASLQKDEIELAARMARCELKAPFASEVVYNIATHHQGADTLRVEGGSLVAIVREMSGMECEVRMQDSKWRVFPTAGLRLEVVLPGGRRIPAPFSGTRIHEEQQRDVIYYVFRMPDAANAELRGIVDGVLAGELVAVLPHPVRVVSKLDLLRAAPGLFDRADWSGGVAQLWPGARLVAAGSAHIAIEERP